jgi:hypothetical protein
MVVSTVDVHDHVRVLNELIVVEEQRAGGAGLFLASGRNRPLGGPP